MNTNTSPPKTSAIKRGAAALLMGGTIAIAGLGMASGTAQAAPGPQDQPAHSSHSQSDHSSHSWYSESDHHWYWCWFDFFNWCWHYSPYQP